MPTYYRKTPYVNFALKTANPNNTIPINLQLLMDLLAIMGPSGEEQKVIEFIIRYVVANIPDCEIDVDNYGNIAITKNAPEQGQFYPCIVAHMDEVCGDGVSRKIIQLNNVLIGVDPNSGEAAGCPGDDRVGVYCALELLKILPVCKVCFFVEEEIGADMGSARYPLAFFKDCAFILQADRAGDNEIIVESNGGQICSDALQKSISKLIRSYNYNFSDMGSFTDCGLLSKRGVGISCINLGAAYFDNHTDEEKVCITGVQNVLNIMHKICIAHSDKRWTNKHRSYYSRYGGTVGANRTGAGEADWRRGFYEYDFGDWEDSTADLSPEAKKYADLYIKPAVQATARVHAQSAIDTLPEGAIEDIIATEVK